MMGLVKALRRIKADREAAGKKFAALNEKYLSVSEKLLYTELAFSLEVEKDEIKERVLDEFAELFV